jgi:hypothetical protein
MSFLTRIKILAAYLERHYKPVAICGLAYCAVIMALWILGVIGK